MSTAFSRIPFELWAFMFELCLASIRGYAGRFKFNKVLANLSHVCRTWRSVVRSSPAFWSALYVGMATVAPSIRNAVSLSGDLPLHVRLELGINGRECVPKLLASVAPAFHRISVLQVELWDYQSFLDVASYLNGATLSAVTSLSLVARRVPAFARNTGSELEISRTMQRIQSVRILRASFVWPLDGNFSALTVLVIRNIIRPFYPTLDEFAAILASAPRLEKFCLRNIGCVGITADVAATFTLPYVSELDVGFAVGDATLPALLRSMDLPALKTLRFTGQGDDEVRYMAAATNVLQVIRTLILDVDDFEDAVLADLFIAAGSVTKIDVLTADADVFDALQEADRMMSAEKNCSAHACPDLSALAVSNADPQCVRSFLEARPDTLERMDSVMFRQGLPLDDYDEDLEWMRTHIAVGAYASYNESYWVDHDIKWS
ncbi:hypothetical protein C8R44DRAFT_895624 [Mycena epipterygia]|nr:hypothetical protein C8R44DRAFT_895624 [Mycena epipterygia]